MGSRNQRSIKNIVIAPLRQLKFCFHIVLINIALMTAAATAFWYYISQYYKVVYGLLKLFSLPEMMEAKLKAEAMSVQVQAFIVLSLCLLLFILITTVVILRFTHKIYGPMININRNVKQAIEGKRAFIKLRKGDDFFDTAELLNKLFTRLEEKTPPDPS